jgi:hypothetical protein
VTPIRDEKQSAAWLILLGSTGAVICLAGFAEWLHAGAPAPHSGGWPDWVLAISTAVIAVILGATARFAWRQLKDAQVTRHGELMLQMGRRWDEAYHESAKVFALHTDDQINAILDNLFGAGTPTARDADNYFTLVRLPNLVEEIADFRRYGAISIDAIDVIWGDRIISAWRQWEPLVLQLRTLLSEKPIASPTTFAGFQNLADELQARRAQDA